MIYPFLGTNWIRIVLNWGFSSFNRKQWMHLTFSQILQYCITKFGDLHQAKNFNYSSADYCLCFHWVSHLEKETKSILRRIIVQTKTMQIETHSSLFYFIFSFTLLPFALSLVFSLSKWIASGTDDNHSALRPIASLFAKALCEPILHQDSLRMLTHLMKGILHGEKVRREMLDWDFWVE